MRTVRKVDRDRVNIKYLIRCANVIDCVDRVIKRHVLHVTGDRLAEFVHRYLPEAHDEHLFTLELLVRSRIKEENMCLATLMGNRDFIIDLEDTEAAAHVENHADGNEQYRGNSLQYSARIKSKTLRCLKM